MDGCSRFWIRCGLERAEYSGVLLGWTLPGTWDGGIPFLWEGGNGWNGWGGGATSMASFCIIVEMVRSNGMGMAWLNRLSMDVFGHRIEEARAWWRAAGWK